MNDALDSFPHQRLDAFHVARDFCVSVRQSLRHLPASRGGLRDQLERASLSTVLSIAEGANRRSRADKRHRFVIARGECGECAAALEIASALGLLPMNTANALRTTADRIGAMLAGLIRRLE